MAATATELGIQDIFVSPFSDGPIPVDHDRIYHPDELGIPDVEDRIIEHRAVHNSRTGEDSPFTEIECHLGNTVLRYTIPANVDDQPSVGF